MAEICQEGLVDDSGGIQAFVAENTVDEADVIGVIKTEEEVRREDRRRYTKYFVVALTLVVVIIMSIAIPVTIKVSTPSPDPEPFISNDSVNPNLKIFDEAAVLLESTPRQFKELPNGEKLSYREYNLGQPHVLVVLPGLMADDTMASIIAVLPQYRDHHIIAINPRGWNGSTMNTPIYSHEENAAEVMELLKSLGIEKTMALGYSSGGGVAFYMAQKYPDIVPVAFLMHSIPLDGVQFASADGKQISWKRDEVDEDMMAP